MGFNAVNIEWPALFKTIEGLKTDVSNRIVIEREIIPIIFVPGIMGSRLVDVEKKKAWDPDDARFMLKRYGKYGVTAKMRKKLLIGKNFQSEYLQVSNDDAAHNKRFEHDEDRSRVERGWGGIYWDSYGDLLLALQSHQWEEPVRHCFEFPVYAFGYNWTDTNMSSGKKLAEYIDNLIKAYTQDGAEGTSEGRVGKDKRLCKYVILISHSMGGLVCRSACNLHGAEKQVLGVLHGVQPTTGAAAAYWRMKAGFERPHGNPSWIVWDWLRNPLKMAKHRIIGRITSWTLGTDGEEVTSLLGNAPGGLELLPNKQYLNNAGNPQWLHVPGRDGATYSFPNGGDPYEEIYRKKEDVFWRMVNPDWLDPKPEKKIDLPNDSNSGENQIDDPWGSYLDNLELAEQFHDLLKKESHPDTYQFYSSGYETVDEIRFKLEKHKFHLDAGSEPGMDISRPMYPAIRGECICFLKYNHIMAKNAKEVVYKVSMAMPSEYRDGGDSTVPDSSGNALNVKKTAQLEIKIRNDWFEQDHQNIYASKKAKELAYTAVGAFALKRIEQEVGPAKKK